MTMKTLVCAAFALLTIASAAGAQGIALRGEGRFGLIGTESGGWTTTLEHRLQLDFSVWLEGDNGLAFGGFTRARMSSTAAGGLSGSRIWIDGHGVRLTFGNQDGALRGAGVSHGYAGGCGVGYNGGLACGDAAGLLAVSQAFNSVGVSPARARLDVTVGQTAFAFSQDQGGSTELGVRSRFGAVTAALGYVRSGGMAISIDGTPFGFADGTFESALTASARYNGGFWSIGAVVASVRNVTDPSAVVAGANFVNYAVSASRLIGPGNLYGYVGQAYSANAFGLSYAYGLGNGATFTIGAERFGTTTTAGVGVAFSF